MADTFRLYKKDGTKITEGPSPLTITGLAADTVVPAGDYQVTRVKNKKESVKVDLPSFTVKAAKTETFSTKKVNKSKD